MEVIDNEEGFNDFGDLLLQIYKDANKDLRKHVEISQGEISSKPPLTAEDTIGASMIERFCPRLEAIRVRDDITLENVISPKLSRTFSVGHNYEQYIRDTVLARLGIMIGKWRCNCCGHIPETVKGDARYPMPEVCEKCESKILLDAHALESPKYKGMRHKKPLLFTYIEEYTKNNLTMLGGYVDGFAFYSNQYYVTEFKTANAYNFRKVRKNGPDVAHMAQIQTYMFQQNYQKGIIWYFNKDTSDELVYYIDYNKDIAHYYNNKALAFQMYLKQGTMPAPICPNKECPRAKKCPVVEQCFNI